MSGEVESRIARRRIDVLRRHVSQDLAERSFPGPSEIKIPPLLNLDNRLLTEKDHKRSRH